MFTKFVVAFCILALAAAFAGSIPVKGSTHKITISQPVTIMGTALKAGEYQVNINAGTITFILGKESHAITGKVETNATKYETDQVRYEQEGDKVKVSEIRVGGTKTRLIFN